MCEIRSDMKTIKSQLSISVFHTQAPQNKTTKTHHFTRVRHRSAPRVDRTTPRALPPKIRGRRLRRRRRFLRAHEFAPLEKSGAKNLAAAVARGRTCAAFQSETRASVGAKGKDGATQCVQTRGGESGRV